MDTDEENILTELGKLKRQTFLKGQTLQKEVEDTCLEQEWCHFKILVSSNDNSLVGRQDALPETRQMFCGVSVMG